MEGRKCRDVLWGENDHGCCREEEALIIERDKRKREGERECAGHRVTLGKHFLKALDWAKDWGYLL